MNIDLHINGVVFTLGEQLDSRKLRLAECTKVGLLSRLLLKAPGFHVVYSSINCNICCFGGKFEVWADLDTSHGSAAMSGTSAYLYFKNLVLEIVKFQVLSNETMAIGSTVQFEKLCSSTFGPPASNSPIYWLDDHSVVLCHLSQFDRSLFVWKTRRHLENYGLSD